MKILLIKPEVVGVFSYTNQVEHEPLELEYLYTVCRDRGHEPVIYDRRYEHMAFAEKMRREKPDVVCVSGYITQQKLMMKLALEAKKCDRSVRVILGGSNVEINYENYYESKADYLYIASGLEGFGKLIDYIDARKRGDRSKTLKEIEGICYRRKGEWIVNPARVETPEDLPVPDRSFFYANKEKFAYLKFRPLALVKNSFSCRKKCNFCFCTNRNSGRYASRTVENLVNEIESLEVPCIHITDDDFLTDREFLLEFARLLRERNIKKQYLIYGRADFIAENEDVIKILAEVGLSLVMVGLEAISDDELDLYNKRTSAAQNEECVRILHKYGVYCAGLFIVHQKMTRKDFGKLYRYIKKRPIFPTISVFTPMQGSRIYDEYKDEMITGDATKQDLFHCLLKPEHMSLTEFMIRYYILSAKAMMCRRNDSLYGSINVPAALLYAAKSFVLKIRRRIIF